MVMTFFLVRIVGWLFFSLSCQSRIEESKRWYNVLELAFSSFDVLNVYNTALKTRKGIALITLLLNTYGEMDMIIYPYILSFLWFCFVLDSFSDLGKLTSPFLSYLSEKWIQWVYLTAQLSSSFYILVLVILITNYFERLCRTPLTCSM
jgi:hypothetical protein